MEMKTIVTSIIGIALAIVIIAAFVVPVLEGVQYTETEENIPTGYATKAIASGVYAPTETGITIDGAALDGPAVNDWIVMSDSLCIYILSTSMLRVADYEHSLEISTSSVTIDSANRTWSCTDTSQQAYTGDLGANAIAVSTSGELGVYRNTPFIVDKDQDTQFFRITGYFTIGDMSKARSVRAIVSGTVDDLVVKQAMLYRSGETTIVLDPENVKAEFTEDSITEVSIKNCQVSATPEVTITVTYHGIESTTTTGSISAIAAPIVYSVHATGTINSVINIAPVLMMVGVILASIGALVIRRE